MQAPRFHHDPRAWAAWFWDLGFFRSGVAREPVDAGALVRAWTVPCHGPDEVAEELLLQQGEAADAYAKLGTPMPPPSSAAQQPMVEEDIRLLSKDPFRFARAPEDGYVHPGTRRFVRLLAEDLPRISRGAFLPVGVTEAWSADRQSVAAVFETAHARHLRGGWLPAGGFDARLAQDVNALVPPGCPLLHIIACRSEDQPCVFLTPQEALGLARKRGWRWHAGQGLDADGVPLRGTLVDWPGPGLP